MLSSTLILLLASFSVGLTYIVNKKLAQTKFQPAVYAAAISLTSAVLAIPLLLYRFFASSSPATWLLILVSVATFSLSLLFRFKALKETDASVVSLVGRLNMVVAALLGIFFLSEWYSYRSSVGLVLIFLSSIVLVYTGRKIALDRGIIFSMFMALFSALASIFDKIILTDFSPFTYAFVNSALVGLLFSLSRGVTKQALTLIQENAALVVASSVLNVAAWTAFLFVLQTTDVSRTFPIFESLSLITPVLLGIVVLKETKKLWQKIVGVMIGAAGIILLG